MKHTDKNILSLSALALSALLLAGCADGGGQGGGEETTGGSATSAATTESTASESAAAGESASASPSGAATAGESASASPSASGAAGVGAEAGAVAGAIVAAEESVAGGQVFEIDRKDAGDGWEVKLAVEDREQEVEVSADGQEVTAQESDDELDQQDRENLAQVQVPLEDAVRTALEEVEGTLDSAQLDTEDGTTVWEVDIDDDQGTSVDVYVNVDNGSVLKVDR
ncbi:PepSY domain-containing protein [Kocuria sp. KH4]